MKATGTYLLGSWKLLLYCYNYVGALDIVWQNTLPPNAKSVVLAKPKIFDKDGKLNVVWKNSLVPNAKAVVFAQLMIFDKDGK